MATAKTFQNDPIDKDTIPRADSIEFQPLHARFPHLLMVEWTLIWLIPTIGWSVFYGRGIIESNWLTGVWPFLLPALFIPFILYTAQVSAKRCGYALREKDIHYKSGVFWQSRVALPFIRIQHVEIERGPLERVMGVATLKFFTAGGGSADMKIPALGMAEAAKLKAFVLEHTGPLNDCP